MVKAWSNGKGPTREVMWEDPNGGKRAKKGEKNIRGILVIKLFMVVQCFKGGL